MGRKGGGFRRRAVVREGGYDLFQRLVVEIVGGPSGNLLRLDLLAELGTGSGFSRDRLVKGVGKTFMLVGRYGLWATQELGGSGQGPRRESRKERQRTACHGPSEAEAGFGECTPGKGTLEAGAGAARDPSKAHSDPRAHSFPPSISISRLSTRPSSSLAFSPANPARTCVHRIHRIGSPPRYIHRNRPKHHTSIFRSCHIRVGMSVTGHRECFSTQSCAHR